MPDPKGLRERTKQQTRRAIAQAGVQQFARMTPASPTLAAAFGQRWHELHEELATAIAQATGQEPFIVELALPDEGAESGDIAPRAVAARR